MEKKDESKRKRVFVTVGTTSFDDLILTILNRETLEALASKGYNYLSLQIGKSSIKPDRTPRYGFDYIEYFQLTPYMEDYVNNADLIISHAGAGSILEALEARKSLIVVINHLLMDDHQVELAQHLYKDKHLYCCNCDTLSNTVQTMELLKLKPFKFYRTKQIVNYINNFMGFE